jgi:hypothetical protein
MHASMTLCFMAALIKNCSLSGRYFYVKASGKNLLFHCYFRVH